MIRRSFAVTGVFLAVILVTVMLLLGWLLGTQSGSRVLWGRVSNAVEGLTAESVDGRLGGPLSVRGLRFENESMRLVIGSLELDWAPTGLLGGEFRLEKLHVDDVAYTQLKPSPPSENTEPFSLPEEVSLPVALEVRDILLKSFEYRSGPDTAPVRVDEAALAASFRNSALSIDRLSAHGPLFRVELLANALARGAYPSTVSLDWQAFPPGLAPLAGVLSVAGDLSLLRVEQTIDAPYTSSQQIEVRNLLGKPDFEGVVRVIEVQLPDIGDTLPAAAVSATLRAEGSISDLVYGADVNVSSVDFGELALDAAGSFRNQVLEVEELALVLNPETSIGARLDVSGRANVSDPTPGFDLQGSWGKLSWPLVGQPLINSGTGRFTVVGTAEDYSVDLTTALTVPGQAEGQLTFSGRGDSEAFELADLQLALLDGSLTGRGNVRWSPQVRGAVTLDGDGINPALLAPDFPGNLTIALRAAGSIKDGAADADIERLSLGGTFRGQPVDVEVKGVLQNAQLRLETLNVRSGDTRISASGSVGDSMDLQWGIDSPDLGHLLPGATGTLAGDGNVAGSMSLPAVNATLRGDAIAYADYRVQQLSLEVDVDLEREAASRLDLTLDEALLGGVGMRRVSVSGSGNRGNHQLTLQVDSPQGAAQLGLSGTLLDEQWSGQLTAGELSYGELAAWSLAGAQALKVSAHEQRLERGCWRSDDARLCLQGRRTGGDVDAALSLEAFDLAYLRSMIPQALSLAGTLEAEAGLRQQAGATPELEVTVNANGVELRSGQSAEQPDELLLSLQPSRIGIEFGDAGMLAELSMPFSSGGGIDARAQVGGGSRPLTDRPLRGTLALALDDLGFLDALSSEIEQAAGALRGDFEFSGTLASPMPDGEMRLADGALALAAPGLNISDIGVRVSSSDGRTLDFDGGATSGQGTLRLGGSARLDGAQTALDIEMDGDSFEVVNTVDARVFVSPDLQITVRETGIAIKGELRVPRAEITPTELPESVVTASTDEVIMTDDGEDESVAAAQRDLEASIRIILGDAVSLDGFGLKARLAGGLTVTQMPGQPTLGSGEVNILNGEYRAYGQGLVIDTGKILFAGGPISQPGINLRALRRPAEGIVVGVSARGPLENPDFSVFSEPGMTQSEQLSWLVLGRPLDGASEGEGNMIAQAALALGLRGGDMLAGRLGEELGVDSVGIETGSGEAGAASNVNQAAFVIGKYLSPDLFVSYGIGLFDSVSTVRLEYSLSESWKVSTESSTLSSGGDVTYTIERR